MLSNGGIGGAPVVSPIRSDLGDGGINLVEQRADLRCVIAVLLSQRMPQYAEVIRIDSQMKLAPAPSRFFTVFFLQPLASPKDFQSGAVDKDMDIPLCGESRQWG